MIPAAYEQIRLWNTTLALRGKGDPHQGPRQVLNQAYDNLRERAIPMAAEIARDLPDFANHDITHLDALWGLADRIAGNALELTPAEAFVLGGAFLVHDLAMGEASYPEGIQELRREEIWNDSISQALRRRLGRPPTREEIEHPDQAAEQAAKTELLRELHARQAERLPEVEWQLRAGGPRFFLIDKPEFREDFGGLIGKLAASHHWPLGRVREEFAEPAVLGAPGEFPAEWTIDPIKVACLLRAADAAHLDARRAPIFLRALRQPAGLSAQHWQFQARLRQPTVENNRLVYTAYPPGFPYAEAQAWWLCLDTLRTVDDELRQIDDLLVVSLRRPYRLEARGVEGVYNLEDFARRVRTNGWEPVDTRVHVTDVAGVVRSLGGSALYGNDRYIPLRELIQNGCDAVRARRLVQDRSATWGEVTVRIGTDDGVPWVEVEDTGVGMSPDVLKGPLLDFGMSFWGSPDMRREFPGLAGKAFEAVGKYGIGFFSVFMWADRVQVVTRRYDAAVEDTRVLSFDAGLDSRPILRIADRAERLQDGGTRVRIWCKEEVRLGTQHHEDSAIGWTKRLGWLCPALDVTLTCKYHGEGVMTAVVASDWVEMSGYALLRRTFEYEEGVEGLVFPDPDNPLALLHDSAGQVVGRAMVTPFVSRSDVWPGVVTVGGMRTSEIHNVAGILLGANTTASRKHAIPVVPVDEFARWATEQGNLLREHGGVAPIITALGGDIRQFEVTGSAGSLSIDEIRQRKNLPEEIIILDGWMTNYLGNGIGADSPLIFAVQSSFQPPLTGPGPRDVWPPLPPGKPDGRARLERTPAGVLISAIAASWGVDVDRVLAASGFNPENGRFDQHENENAFAFLPAYERAGVGERIFAIRKP